jgi:hypothetical protein
LQRLAVITLLFALALPAYLAGVGRNPPGYFVDESKISYNAWTIATHGVDESGNRWPLFFKAGDYYNPLYIYLLALLFKIFGPSVGLARGLSAVLAELGAAAFSWLGWTISGKRRIGVATFFLAAVTASIFEVGHLVFEAAIYPLVIALFLIALWYAHGRWRPAHVIAVAVTLALVTYGYTAGRLWGPLLAAGLLFFAARERIRAILAVWAIYALLAPIPMAIFHFANDHALTARYQAVRSSSSPLREAGEVLGNYVGNADPIGESLSGDLNERHHVAGSGGNVLAATFVLAAGGLVSALRRRSPWDRFLVYGLGAGLVPASLTHGTMHMLRVMPYTMLLFPLAIEGMMMLKRPVIAAAFVLAAVQAAWFFYAWSTRSAERFTVYDCCVPRVLDVALAQHRFPIYVTRTRSDPDVLWFAMLRGVGREAFVFGPPPPPGAVAITTFAPCPGCRVLVHDQLFRAYVGSGRQ